MALRRLLSGWLIAVAALARFVAQALERGSEDRSTPAPDPIMAALAERYPGAPTHWLAHVAERTSQLSEQGEVPLSLNSDPSPWPLARPDDPPSGHATPTGDESASRDPGRLAPSSHARAASPAVPRDRSPEVRPRPDGLGRRPRPVFAPLASARPSEGPAATPGPGATPSRRRSPLTVFGPSVRPVPSALEHAEPTSEPSASKTSQRAAIWPETPSSPGGGADAMKAGLDARGAAERPPPDHAFAQARRTDGAEEPPEARSRPPPALRRRSWFFARSARVAPSLRLSEGPARRTKEEGENPEEAIRTPSRRPASSVETGFRPPMSDPSSAPGRTRMDQAATARRPSLFGMLAAFGVKPRADYPTGSSRPTARTTASIDRPSPDSPLAPAAMISRPPRPLRSAGPAYAFSHVDIARQDKRPIFAAPPPFPARPVARHFASPQADERWPPLPPTTVGPPPGLEASPPRWEQLSREQEEGRWSV
jgi:hypothetical protein